MLYLPKNLKFVMVLTQFRNHDSRHKHNYKTHIHFCSTALWILFELGMSRDLMLLCMSGHRKKSMSDARDLGNRSRVCPFCYM